MMELLDNPLYMLILAGVLILIMGAVLYVVRTKRKHTKTSGVDSKVQKYAEDGNFEAAANVEMHNGNLELAMEYFLRAGKPLRAAQMAQRLDQPRKAAELYENAGDLERASALYREAGMTRKADELAPELEKAQPRLGDAPGERPSHDSGLLTPLDRAEKLERKFLATAEAYGPAEQVEQLGRETAEALLSVGETRRAAEVCVKAGLDDQAINLFVNLLGDPGAAAALLGERGDHKRAAELYEAAGKKERALEAWLGWAHDAPDPLGHISAIERLGDDTVFEFFSAVERQRPLSPGTVDLHYRIADGYARHEKMDSAIQIMNGIQKIDPGYKDVGAKIDRFQGVIAQIEERKRVEREKERAEAIEKSIPPGPEVTGHEQTALSMPPAPDPQLTGHEATALSMVPPQSADQSIPLQQPLESLLDNPAIENLVSEVAAAAVREASAIARGVQMPDLNALQTSVEPDAAAMAQAQAPPGRIQVVVRGKPRTVMARGIERAAISLRFVNDSAVEDARNGPTISELDNWIDGREADLQNIELYYRLGLAHAAQGHWLAARDAFQCVEDASPGYRDADDRVEEIDKWKATTPEIVKGESAIADTAGGRYKLMGEIGRGGMAVVYRAFDEALERDVALKFVSEEISAQPTMLKMFMREAQSAAKLNHTNIVTVYDVGKIDGRAFICMEFVKGETVEDMIDESDKLRVLDALRITRSILEALEYAHARHIIHRDIKPSNMMRNELGVVKLMDFGLAKSMKQQAKTTLIAGTPSYMPPEQFTGKDMDDASDIFSVGASLYEMLAGETPFKGMSRDTPPVALREINPTVPKILERTVEKSLELDKARRFRHAREMLTPIEQIIEVANNYMKQHGTRPSIPPESAGGPD